jgi:LmbE family N-acetylglucosaminyl deacetylase
MQRLLCITAHPDDEAGGFGGTLRLYADRGVETHVICLTEGQAASNRGNARSGEELARMRRAEIAESCRLLSVAQSSVLHYPDAGLDKTDFLTVVGDLVHRVRQIKPNVIMTFGGEGAITAHPDHSMAGWFATAAFHWAGRTNRFPQQLEQEGLKSHQTQKLYYQTTDFILPDRQPISPAPMTATIEIGAEYLDLKIKAFRCHSSQSPLFELFERNVRKRGTREQFHLAAASAPQTMKHETDLFEGVTA